MAATSKIKKRLYLHNGLTDQHEIWHNNAYRASKPDWQLKFPTFKNPR